MSGAALAEVSLYDIEAMFGQLQEVTEEQIGCTFDELSMIVAAQPDDELALSAVKMLVIEARDRGFMDQAMQMAMTLGAMACTHTHMQELANDVGSLFYDGEDKHLDNDHDNGHSHSDEHHDSKTCKDCKAGRPCRKKH
jgi:hypothetical protein